jgi:hypothetical protein
MSLTITLLLIALSGVCVSRVITLEGELFYFYWKWIEPLPDWLNKPLGGCSKCFTGQVAFWSYIFLFDYNLFYHILFTLSAITIAYIVDLIITKLED